jgi:predicted tellurium resistance membrane protein TerC
MKQRQSITSLPESPDADRRRRMTRYFIAMVTRVLCIVLCFFVHGWWLLLPIVGALVLPYIAVVLANVGSGGNAEVLRPGAVVPVPHNADGADE